MTRRIVKPQPTMMVNAGQRMWTHEDVAGHFGEHVFGGCFAKMATCPYGVPGDYLWCRETWGYRGGHWSTSTPDIETVLIHYRADDARADIVGKKGSFMGLPKQRPFNNPHPADSDAWWDAESKRTEYLRRWWDQDRPSIHMPRWASRLTLKITEVRVQRLQEITKEDALAEGIDRPESDDEICAQDAYRELWLSINGPGSWEANPWVWCLTFDTIKANVERITEDWMEKRRPTVVYEDYELLGGRFDIYWTVRNKLRNTCAKTLRAAIDEAMKEKG